MAVSAHASTLRYPSTRTVEGELVHVAVSGRELPEMSWIVTLGVVILAGVAAYVAVRGTILYRNRSRYVVKEIHGFLSDEECAHLITRAAPFLKKSAVVGRDTRRTQIERDSGTVFLGQGGDPIVQRIKKRIAELSGTRVAQQERIQITHYDEQPTISTTMLSVRGGRTRVRPATASIR